MNPLLSIVIPAYNEAGRVRRTLEAISEYAAGREVPAEIIVVDDGSRDATAHIVARAARTQNERPHAPPIRLIRESTNRGKGFALRRGVAVSRGTRVLTCDADLSTPIEELDKLASRLDLGFDIAIASRDLPESRLAPAQPPLRRLAALAFQALRSGLLLPGLRDTQCGFKLFRGTLARSLFADAHLDGWLIDCEVLALAARRGYRIAEVGVTWRDDRDSRVRPLRDAPRTAHELLTIMRRWARE
ncbi:MAG: dolichyl-phosphate beta-glucosyltransferase [Phycisphaerae bacterium]